MAKSILARRPHLTFTRAKLRLHFLKPAPELNTRCLTPALYWLISARNHHVNAKLQAKSDRRLPFVNSIGARYTQKITRSPPPNPSRHDPHA